MPPVTPQSSRAGLITAVVIFVVLFVAATIFAIYYAVDANKTHDRLQSIEGQIVKLKNDLADTSRQAKEKLDELTAASNQMAKDMEAVRAQATQETQAAASDRQAKQKNVGDIQKSAEESHQKAMEELNKAQV